MCELSYPKPELETVLQPVFLHFDVIGPHLAGNALARCLRTVLYPPSDLRHV
jgi:hypothetical protein